MCAELAGRVRQNEAEACTPSGLVEQPDPSPTGTEFIGHLPGIDAVTAGGSARRHFLLTTEVGFRCSDLCMVAVAMWMARMAGGTGAGHASLHLLQAGIALLLTNLVFSVRGLYRDGTSSLVRLDLQRLLVAWWLAFSGWLFTMLLIAAAILLADPVAPILQRAAWFEARPLTLFFFSGILLIAMGRLALMQLCTLTAGSRDVGQRTCIVGYGPTGRSLSRHLVRRNGSHLQLLGYIDDGGSGASHATFGDLPLLGGLHTLTALINRGEVDTVLVATPWSEPERINAIMRWLASLPVSVALLPEQIMFDFPHRMVRTATGLPMLQVCEPRMSDWSRALKKLEDMALALLLLSLVAPVMAVIAVAIKLDSPGPVLFTQRRYGIANRLINVYKFRTMHVHLSDHDCEQQTVRGDPRLTRVGAFLRRFSLDEFPQLLNVLTGEMSVVGPRPHALSTKAEGQLFEDAVATYMARHRVKPGITGWAQVNGWRGETDTLEKIAKRVEHDLYYIGNWSPALDLFILVRTVGAVFKNENAY
jgi:Undecaprenyl-phosphate glucose phosphotransferase